MFSFRGTRKEQLAEARPGEADENGCVGHQKRRCPDSNLIPAKSEKGKEAPEPSWYSQAPGWTSLSGREETHAKGTSEARAISIIVIAHLYNN